ncbi:LysR family transcriptional regulator [Enterobacillus tribolii]|uniref:LysR family transcriptional regulator n=1 Tax=Enterobacillus tribolii TaxID=1487935 RepID=A0A370QHW8_9GAMM|nr:LysR family transcriptional regulator [Enterobacillus tribolii]MBW7982675.1 LysR family transcriptional regulator [Enterobacillus tribolii]RDK87954.1 LysR family transcriptional regulator [Enterobacillus tribolii]
MKLLNDMALFVEVAKARSFRKAAEVLNMPNSTLSRHISQLEKEIGLRLLHRTTRRIELTEAGQVYFERCKRIVDEARLAHEQLGGLLEQPTGLLRVSMPVDLATTFLAPHIAAFAHDYPGIDFDLTLTPRQVDLVTEPFDVAIRMGDLPSSTLIARRLGTVSRALYASPGYLKRAGEPREPEALKGHECLRLRTAESREWRLHKEEAQCDITVPGRFLLNSVGMIRNLALLDMGIAMLAENMVAQDLSEGRLQRVLPGWQARSVPVYAMTETRLLPAKTQRFIDFLRERFVIIEKV